jgi:hypothetical protein
MKRFFLALSSALFLQTAVAQLPANSVAPNFTATDLNGNSYTLYDLLDQGITVFLDVSATWCGPCWNYHNTHKLRDLYNQYGPTGTITPNKVMVFFAEGDAQTSLADLQGTGGNTQGNWVAGTTYPILHATGPQIANAYEINAFPTLYVICPNRLVNTFAQSLTVAQMYALATACPIATQPVDAGIVEYSGPTVACDGNTADLRVLMQNMGTQPLTDCTIEALDAGGTVVASNTWNGNLASYGLSDILVGTVPVNGSANYTFRVTAANDGAAANNETTGGYVSSGLQAQGTRVRLELQLDNYPAETSWYLFNSVGSTVASGVYAAGDANQLKLRTFLLYPNECYRFQINDSYGDGICCGTGNGFYRLIDFTTGATLLDVNGATANFSQREDLFKSGAATGLEDLAGGAYGLKVFPNPTSDRFTLEYRLEEAGAVSVAILNALGQPVKNVENLDRAAGTHSLAIDTRELPEGTYAVLVRTANGSAAQLFSVLR